MQVPPAVVEEDEEAAGLLADVREQQQHFVGLHRAREQLRKGLQPPAALKLHAQRLQQDRSQLQRRVAQAQANLSPVTDADAIKVSLCFAGHSDCTFSRGVFTTVNSRGTTGPPVPID